MVTSPKHVVGHLLGSYRTRERDMLSAPHDPELRRGFEDTAATLCEVMKERTAREAAQAAERYVGHGRPGAGAGAGTGSGSGSGSGSGAGTRGASTAAGRCRDAEPGQRHPHSHGPGHEPGRHD